MTELSSTQIREKIRNGEKFLLDFYAPWCGPCKGLMTLIERVENQVELPIYKFNVDSDPKFTSSQNVRSVPTIKLFDGENFVKTSTGMMNESSLLNFAKNE